MPPSFDYDYLIVGSGFGGSVSALRLTEKGYKVLVVEMGRRWTPEDLPKTNWTLNRYFWKPKLGLRGFFNLRFFRHVIVLHGNAVGGGSITYANTMLVPPDTIWDQGTWAGLDDWKRVMPSHYATAKRMLGVVTNPILAPADIKLREMATAAGVGHTFYPADVAVFFGNADQQPGTLSPDPYFDGEGPARETCIACGGCMVGCRHNAKNTLDKNYLYLAEKKGARVLAETTVIDVRPLNGAPDGSQGYEVFTQSSNGWFKGPVQCFTTRGVVFAGSSLGTQELLFRLKQRGSLPNISDQLGNRVLTNAESLIAVRYPGTSDDLSSGIAIGSGIYIDANTHIEAVRYPRGSDALSPLSTLLVNGRPGPTRILTWLTTLGLQFLKSPLRTFRDLQPFGASHETLILLCMQAIDSPLTMRLTRPWYWPFVNVLTTAGDPIPTYIPTANRFAELGASVTGGVPCTTITEVLFNIPMTAHCLGGAAMADTPERGVIDSYHRVFGYTNLYICDGSAISANLGVNPALTIAALTERAMQAIPPKTVQPVRDPAICSKSTPCISVNEGPDG
ncbi:MAG TPA: GMC family oxidoreductase [Acidobacteriaceae bacterium]|nr:GMC family oxidoreductase [Acidobacteriaceae bacterium]